MKKDDFPLQDRAVVITRSQDQIGEAQLLFKNQGATIFDLPALIIGPPDDWASLDEALQDLETFHWLIFSSSNGVRAVEGRLNRINKTLADLPIKLKVAVVGRKTAASLESFGVTPDIVPPEFVADSLIKHFPVSGFGLKILIPRVQTGGRTILSKAFLRVAINEYLSFDLE